ncbi:MAG TPA: hypothetical protein GXX46_09930 [Peptococcaceae bacterium]|nr:hypothetical protein [Peptococcaceae bacterium]
MKRNEATLEQWQELYEVTMRIRSLQPWEYLWDMDLVTLQIPEFEQPFFASVMGRNGECFAIAVMEGTDALLDFYRLADAEDIPPGQLIRYQNNMTCYFGDREELSSPEREIIKKLGLKFRGRNQWIFFRSFAPGYAPITLDQEQVVKLTRVFQELFMALKAYLENQIQVNFEKGQTLFRYFDPEQGLWFTTAGTMDKLFKKYRVPVVEDEILIKRLKGKKKTESELEIDTLYLNVVIDDSQFARPIMPVMLILADHKSGMLIDQEMLAPGDDNILAVLGSLISYIENFGKPKKVIVRDEGMAHLLLDLCKRVNIQVDIKGRLDAIDVFAEEFEKFNFE